MNEEFQKILEESFNDYEKYHSIILILFAIILAFIQGLQSLFFSRKLDRFKSELKKSEIKFSKYNNLQIEALSKLYHLLVDFQDKTIKIKKITVSSHKYIRFANQWGTSLYKCNQEFSKERYILPIKIKEKTSNILNDFSDLFKYIKSQRDLIEMTITYSDGSTEYAGDNDELDAIFKEINKYKNSKVFLNSLNNINDLKNDIEKIFEEME